MKLLVGLGNPGREYEATRHNIGFVVLDSLAQEKSLSWRSGRFQSETASYDEGDEKFFLIKPQTFMNRSGLAVGECFRFYKLSPQEMFVVYDDLDIPFGKIKLGENGSAGGHRGVASLLENLGTDIFYRVRVGIGRPAEKKDVVDYVLRAFSKEEQKSLMTICQGALEAIRLIGTVGMEKAKNKIHGMSFL